MLKRRRVFAARKMCFTRLFVGPLVQISHVAVEVISTNRIQGIKATQLHEMFHPTRKETFFSAIWIRLVKCSPFILFFTVEKINETKNKVKTNFT